MRFLLDTNAVSEPKRQAPDDGFMAWLQARSVEELGTSALVIGELRRGAMRLPIASRRSAIEDWLNQVTQDFGQRVLPIDTTVATTWAGIALQHKAAGKTIGAIDALIAATAVAHQLTVVTRNVRHFEGSGCKLLCPWMA